MSTKNEPAPDSSTIWDFISLVVTLSVIGAIAYAGKLILDGVNSSVANAKESFGKQGLTFDEKGVSVKTDKRPMTTEETQDALQAGIFKGWKATTFNVPWTLAKGSHLSGSSHDKNKAEWEAKHGSKTKKVD